MTGGFQRGGGAAGGLSGGLGKFLASGGARGEELSRPALDQFIFKILILSIRIA